MSTERSRLTINNLRVEIVRKDIKNLHLGVYPPNGRVRVATPHRVNDDAVRLGVLPSLGGLNAKGRDLKPSRANPYERWSAARATIFSGDAIVSM